jgi:hypothetical protein
MLYLNNNRTVYTDPMDWDKIAMRIDISLKTGTCQDVMSKAWEWAKKQ